jgi:hypothetical protein
MYHLVLQVCKVQTDNNLWLHRKGGKGLFQYWLWFKPSAFLTSHMVKNLRTGGIPCLQRGLNPTVSCRFILLAISFTITPLSGGGNGNPVLHSSLPDRKRPEWPNISSGGTSYTTRHLSHRIRDDKIWTAISTPEFRNDSTWYQEQLVNLLHHYMMDASHSH